MSKNKQYKSKIKMGIIFGSANQRLEKGKFIKQNLYQKVKRFRQKYHQEILKINPKLKKHVIMLGACELVSMLQKKQITSYQIVLIFAERTSVFGLQNNYVFQEMFEDALQKAKQYDKLRSLSPQKINWKGDPGNRDQCFPPFFGIPASYKQNLKFKGKTSHVGFIEAHQRNVCSQQHGLFTQLTLKMGFVPFVRTNMPMSGKTIQTNNNMFGYCKNPWNQQRSCGGSSGGQGGLIGSYCSPIGFGTDLGGSLRIPAQFSGLISLKPGNRYSKAGNSYLGKLSGGAPLKGQIAPITRSVEDIKLFMKFMLDQRNYHQIKKQILDPYINLRPFSDDIFIKRPKLKIGYIIHLETVSCSPSHERVVNQAINILKSQGHELKQIKMPNFEQLYFSMLQIYMADGTTKFLSQVSEGEPYIKQLKLLKFSSKIPNFVKSLISWAIQGKEPRMAKILDKGRSLRVGELFTAIHDMVNQHGVQAYRNFIDNQIDAIIMPGFAFPSFKLGLANKFHQCCSYTAGWNAINYPSGVIPMGLVQQNQQYYKDQFNDTITKTVNQSAKQSKGMPVGVQVVSLPFKQELILFLMETIEKKVQFRKRFSCLNALKQPFIQEYSIMTEKQVVYEEQEIDNKQKQS